MTIRDLLESGICIEGILVINRYDVDEPEQLFSGLEISGQWIIQDFIKDMKIKYMYATTYSKADEIETAALIIEVEED